MHTYTIVELLFEDPRRLTSANILYVSYSLLTLYSRISPDAWQPRVNCQTFQMSNFPAHCTLPTAIRSQRTPVHMAQTNQWREDEQRHGYLYIDDYHLITEAKTYI